MHFLWHNCALGMGLKQMQNLLEYANLHMLS